MIKFTTNAEQWAASLSKAEREQLPYAIMKGINATALDVQDAQQEKAMRSFTVRRHDFIMRTIKINRGDFATKANPRAIVQVDPQRDVLMKHEDGGPKVTRGKSVAIPKAAKRSKADIVTKANRPKAFGFTQVKTKTGTYMAKGSKRAFIIKKPGGFQGILQRVGRGRGKSRLRVLFLFKGKAILAPRLSFTETAKRVVKARLAENIAAEMEKAMGRGASIFDFAMKPRGKR